MNDIERRYEDMLDHQRKDVKSAWEDAKLPADIEEVMKSIVRYYCRDIADLLTKLSLSGFVPTPRLHRIFCEELLLKCLEIDKPNNILDRLSAIFAEEDEEEEEEEDEITAIINKVLKELHNR